MKVPICMGPLPKTMVAPGGESGAGMPARGDSHMQGGRTFYPPEKFYPPEMIQIHAAGRFALCFGTCSDGSGRQVLRAARSDSAVLAPVVLGAPGPECAILPR